MSLLSIARIMGVHTAITAPGGVVLLAGIVILTVLCVCGIAVVIAAHARSFSEGSLLTDALGAGLVFLAPVYCAPEALPRIVQLMSRVFPTTYAARGVRTVLAGGSDVGVELAILAGMAVITLAAGFDRFGGERTDGEPRDPRAAHSDSDIVVRIGTRARRRGSVAGTEAIGVPRRSRSCRRTRGVSSVVPRGLRVALLVDAPLRAWPLAPAVLKTPAPRYPAHRSGMGLPTWLFACLRFDSHVPAGCDRGGGGRGVRNRGDRPSPVRSRRHP